MVDTLLCLIPLLPLLACLITVVLGPKVLRDHSHWPTVLACAGSSFCALLLLYKAWDLQSAHVVNLYEWISVLQPDRTAAVGAALPWWRSAYFAGDSLRVIIGLQVDTLAAIMLAMVSFISTLVAVFASGYMHGERGYWRFFSAVALFVFSMLMLVLSPNFLQLYMFWELVGFCSYLLIGFWYEKPSAAAAGKKAFVVNRIGDFGFAIGVFLIWVNFGTLDFSQVLNAEHIALKDPDTIALICLCLFTGAIGKSAQFPLHVWLPDAMEGPTPVSALIHAATMVTAGVYMVTRCTPLFSAAPDVQLLVAFIGAFTALLAGLIALTQTDLKRVLAYSTVSQLGYMFLGLGTGSLMGITGAMFHLVTHAFFKALLFLGSGSVMHAMGGIIDMRKFSGLRRLMPQTATTFLIGSLALAGVWPLSGFWSKDTILAAVWETAHGGEAHAEHAPGNEAGSGGHTVASGASHGSPVPPAVAQRDPNAKTFLLGLRRAAAYKLLFCMAMFTALLTSFYTFRAYFMTFHGPERIPPEAGHHAHESPAIMTIPLWILAVGAAFLGLSLGHWTGWFGGYLDHTLAGAGAEHHAAFIVVALSWAASLTGVLVAYVFYGRPSRVPAMIAAGLGPLTRLSQNKFYLDEVYRLLVVLPLLGFAQVCRLVDMLLIDGLLVGGISRLPAWFIARPTRPIQNGLVQFYALSMVLAMGVLLVVLLWPH